MKKNKFCIGLLSALIVLSAVTCYAENVSLDVMLRQLSKSRLTSLQKLELIEQYTGKIVAGKGKVKDVIKSYGTENEAMVYLSKPVGDKQYELVIMAPQEEADKVRKGKTVGFEGVFAGMSFETLRFKNARITKKRKSWWPF